MGGNGAMGAAMQPDTLCAMGAALFGPAWKAALAQALGVTPAFVSRVAHGHKPMPADWPARLLAIAQARHRETAQAIATLSRAA